jgi:biotin carboxyl carrier protein
MRFRKYLPTLLALAAVGGVAFAAYTTRGRWLPHVFPAKPEAKPGGEKDAPPAHAGEAERVELSPEAQANLGLDKEGAVDNLVPTEYWRRVPVPGVIVDRPGESDRGVTSKVAGVVTEIRAKPGDTVRAGEPLFKLELASEFLQGTQAELAKAATDLGFAATERDRVANLVKAGTTAGSELAKVQNQVDRLTTQVNGHRRQLQLFGLTPAQVNAAEKGEVITQMTIFAPARTQEGWFPFPDDLLYEVQELSVQRGAQVQAGQTLCLLANHQRLYVEGQAFASETRPLADAAEKRLPVPIEFPGETPGDWPAVPPLVVHHLGTPAAAGTTFPFYLALENQYRHFAREGKTYFAWRFRPGQRVRLRLPVEKVVTLGPDGKTEVLPFVLPAGAIVREGAEAFVFVQNGDLFVKRPVRVLYEDRNETVIARGGDVSTADFVVRTPAAAAINRALKAAASKGAGGDPHAGHSHD